MPKAVALKDYFRKKGLKPAVELLYEAVALEDMQIAGQDGRDGKDGKDGSVGPRGPAGRDGKGLNWRGMYKPSESYAPDDLVEYLGSSYICVKPAKNKPPNQSREFWNLFSAAGASGATGAKGDTVLIGAPTFIQETQPDYDGSYVWVQTGLGADGTDYSVWYNIC